MESTAAAPEDDQAAQSPPGDTSPVDGGENVPPRKQVVRKRTKTGCLTCRKRRIKCDEGKPICSNCIKSKRDCEGYNQRVVFKEPIGAFHGGPFAPIVYQAEPSPGNLGNAQLANTQQSKTASSSGPLPNIAPKPPHLDFGRSSSFHAIPPYPGQQHQISVSSLEWSPGSYGQPGPPPDASFFQERNPSIVTQLNYPKNEAPSYGGAPASLDDQDVDSSSASVPQTSVFSEPQISSTPSSRDGKLPQYQMDVAEEDYWYSDDDASMAESEDDAQTDRQANHLESNDLGILVRRRMGVPVDSFGTQLRTFKNFDDNVLATYIPSSTNSPLNNIPTAEIFQYFVNVTGPSMSLYERHPLDPTPMFHGHPVPKARQHIWTYTMPIISLNHPALLQAMLALGSLQMAKLQGIPATASMKHYHLSLRRVAKNYQSPGRRAQPATLAATLLLGFYEVWNSDHDLWCKHMWGARAILKEIPLAKLTRGILALRRKKRQQMDDCRSMQDYPDQFASGDYHLVSEYDDISTAVLSQISGKPVSYDEPGYVAGEEYDDGSKRYTEKDVETYELVRDLYWWYCKMDVYQSFLGATRLLMDYDLWTQCTPRAPIGRIDAIFGTFDHLMLLLGRLANFAARDRTRKQMAKKPDGPPGSAGGPPPGQSPPLFAGMMPSRGIFTVPTGFSPPREPTPPSDDPDEVDFEARTATALREWDDIRQAFEVFKSHLGPDFDAMGPEYMTPMMTPFGLALVYRTYSIAGIWMNFYMGMINLYRAHPTMPPIAMIAAGMAARQTAPYAVKIGQIAAGLVGEEGTGVPAVSTLVGAALIESCFPLFVSAIQYQNLEQRHFTIKRMYDVARLTGWQSAMQIAGGCEAAWMKAASLGRGPPYQPPPEIQVQAPQSVWTRSRRIDERIKELDDEEGKVILSTAERPKYALGLLFMEDDLKKLDLREDS